MQTILFALDMRPAYLVAVCVGASIVGLLLIGCGSLAITGQRRHSQRRWRRLLDAVGLIDTSKASRRTVGVSQLIAGIVILVAAVGVLFSNGPLASMSLLALTGSLQKPEAAPRIEARRPKETLPDLGPAPAALDAYDYDSTRLQMTATLGSEGGEPVLELAKDNAVLVGFRFTTGLEGAQPGAMINSIQAIYQRDNNYLLGKVIGTQGPDPHQRLADSGSVISALEANSRFQLVALRPTFRSFRQRGFIGDGKNGDWLGEANETGDMVRLAQPAVGMVVFVGSGSISGVKLLYYDESLARLPVRAEQELPHVKAAESVLEVDLGVPRLESAQAMWQDQFKDSVVDKVMQAKDGGLLVGFQMTFSERYWGNILTLSPIFQAGHRYHVFASSEDTPGKTFLAKDGYAVGGIAKLGWEAVQVTFMRVQENGALDPSDSYRELVGSRDPFRADADHDQLDRWLSDGLPVVGMRYKQVQLEPGRESMAELSLMLADIPR